MLCIVSVMVIGLLSCCGVCTIGNNYLWIAVGLCHLKHRNVQSVVLRGTFSCGPASLALDLLKGLNRNVFRSESAVKSLFQQLLFKDGFPHVAESNRAAWWRSLVLQRANRMQCNCMVSKSCSKWPHSLTWLIP